MKEEISRYRTHAKWSWGRHWCEMNEQKYQHNVEAIGLWEGIERKSKLYLKIIAMIIILNGFTNHPIPSNATNHPIPSNATTTWLLRLQLQEKHTNEALSAFMLARPPTLKVFRKKDVELVLAGPSTMAGRTVKCYLTSESDKNCGRESCSRRLFIAFHSASYTVSPSWIYPLCRGVSKFNPLRHHRPRSVNTGELVGNREPVHFKDDVLVNAPQNQMKTFYVMATGMMVQNTDQFDFHFAFSRVTDWREGLPPLSPYNS